MAYLDLDDRYEKDSFTPTIEGSVSNPTVTYTIQTGAYERFENLVWVKGFITINTISGGSGNLRIVLPFTSQSSVVVDAIGNCYFENVDFPANTKYVVSLKTVGDAFLYLQAKLSTASSLNLQISDLANGDTFVFSIHYWV